MTDRSDVTSEDEGWKWARSPDDMDRIAELEAEVERLQQVITDAYHLMNLGRYDRASSDLANAVNLFGRHLRDVLAPDSPALWPSDMTALPPREKTCPSCGGTGCEDCDGSGIALDITAHPTNGE